MKLKKALSAILAGVMTFTFMSSGAITAGAASKRTSYSTKNASVARVWDGTYDADWFTKDPKKKSYDIYTAEELAGLNYVLDNALQDDRFQGVTINLMNDIVLNDTSNFKNWEKEPPKNTWNPIGEKGSYIASANGYRPFAGVFNGNGHTISGMYCNVWDWSPFYGNYGSAGLFRCLAGAVVQDLKMEKCYCSAPSEAGAVAGFCQGSYFQMVEVENCKMLSYGNSAGIIGSSYKFMHGDIFAVLFYFGAAAVTGIALNPLLFINDFGRKEEKERTLRDTAFIYSKVSDCELVCWDKKSSSASGFIGSSELPIEFYGCISENNKSVDAKNKAAFISNLGTKDYAFKKCYASGMGDKDALKDNKNFTNVKSSEIKKSGFEKKLGEYFVYDKGNSPKIKTIIETPVHVVLSGKNVKLSWQPVSKAKEYKIFKKESNGNLKCVSTTSKTTATLKNIKKGSSRSYVIRAYFEDGTYKTVKGGELSFRT